MTQINENYSSFTISLNHISTITSNDNLCDFIFAFFLKTNQIYVHKKNSIIPNLNKDDEDEISFFHMKRMANQQRNSFDDDS